MDLNFSWNLSLPEIYGVGIFALIWIIEMVYQFYLFDRPFRFYRKSEKGKIPYSAERPALSVIVYAQNDAENLIQFMPRILNQDYPQFEVIVVSDDSTDDSKDILTSLQAQYDNLYFTYVPEGSRNLSHKKLALTLGIKAARYDIVVFTNANCCPPDNQWLASIARNFVPGTDIVLGYTSPLICPHRASLHGREFQFGLSQRALLQEQGFLKALASALWRRRPIYQ